MINIERRPAQDVLAMETSRFKTDDVEKLVWTIGTNKEFVVGFVAKQRLTRPSTMTRRHLGDTWRHCYDPENLVQA